MIQQNTEPFILLLLSSLKCRTLALFYDDLDLNLKRYARFEKVDKKILELIEDPKPIYYEALMRKYAFDFSLFGIDAG